MNKFAISAFAASMFMITGIAWATADVTGKIRSIDTRAHEIVLQDGQYYLVPVDINLNSFKVGNMVTVTIHQYHDGLNYVVSMAKND